MECVVFSLWPYLLYSKGYRPIGFRTGCHRAKKKLLTTHTVQLIEFVDDKAPYFLFGSVAILVSEILDLVSPKNFGMT